MKKILITQSNYIPWKGYFDSINMVDEIVLFDDAQYTKRDWRNRNKIKTPAGPIWLTIPVDVKGKFSQKIKDTKISDKDWNKNHWLTLSHAYNKAPHYKELKPFFEELYLTCHHEFLSDINYHFLTRIAALLKIHTAFKWSSDFVIEEGKTERLVSICKQTSATDYYSGPSAKDYMDEPLFEKANINVHYFDYSGYPVYPQLHGEFTHEVSIIDLLFNTGPTATQFMKSFSHQAL